MAAYFTNADGSIRDFTTAEIAAIGIETLGIRDGSHPTHTRELDQSTVTAEYLIEPAYFDRFCAYMLGAQLIYTFGLTTSLSRLPPQQWPRNDIATGEAFAAVKIPQATNHLFQLDDVADASFPIPTYEKMKVRVLFQHVPFAVLSDLDTAVETDRYVQTLPSQHQVSYLNLPGSIMKYQKNGGGGPSGKTVPYSIGFPVPESVISRKWIRLPFEAWGPGSNLFTTVNGDQVAGIKPYVGSVNLTPFLGYPAGHLLYLGVEEELQLDPLGIGFCWNLTHKWLVKYYAPHTWFYYHPVADADKANAGWYYVAKADAGYSSVATMPDDESVFHAREHADLFKVG